MSETESSYESYDKAITMLEEILMKIEDEVEGIDELVIKVKTASDILIFCRQKLRSTEEEINRMLDNLN